MVKKFLPLLLIFILAFTLRTYRLAEIPPGLTHDEANHGREALGVLNGVTPFFFPYNYGSEPLYSYTLSGSIVFFGKNVLALRLVNVLFSLGAMGIAYLWAARAFDRKTGLVAAALTAVSFWPLASSREALRAGMLPFFMAGAVWFFWQLVQKRKNQYVVGFALFLAATFYIYLAARAAWLVFPLFLVYLAVARKEDFRLAWRPALSGLLFAGLLVAPMLIYLRLHPDIITRLGMLDGPLQRLRDGDWQPIWANVGKGLLAFFWPGAGDQFLAYNIPGRPVFDGITAVFFLAGILVSLTRWRRPAYAFLLLWFGVGILPSLITGPTANTTRNLAALPAVYLLPAVGFVVLIRLAGERLGWKSRPFLIGSTLLWLAAAGWFTSRDYFIRWGPSPEVRGAYQHTLVETLAYLEQNKAPGPVILSTVYPGVAHDPSIGLVLMPEQEIETRWVDARAALLWPEGNDAQAIIPASTPLHPALAALLRPLDTVMLQPDDLNPYFTRYEWDIQTAASWLPREPVANFDDAVTLLDARWLQPDAAPGGRAEMLTIWRVKNPARVGPAVPPANTTDVVLFTQVLTADGLVLAQQDALDAPSWDWQAGDVIFQIHSILLPPEIDAGEYRTIVGLYDRLSGERRPVVDAGGQVVDSFADVAPLHIVLP